MMVLEHCAEMATIVGEAPALHLRDPRRDPGARLAMAVHRRLLQELNADVRGDGIMAAGMNDPGTTLDGPGIMGIDHRSHPLRLSG